MRAAVSDGRPFSFARGVRYRSGGFDLHEAEFWGNSIRA
jgi:hypothetical protein